MSVEDNELEHRINQMRKNLILIAKENGLYSDDTLRYSQKLDELITIYQKRKNEPYRCIKDSGSAETGYHVRLSK